MSSNIKYIGLDVHKEAISIAVLNDVGKWVMESIIETKAATLLQFLQGLQGELHVTLEEGGWAAWLYDVPASQISACYKLPICCLTSFLCLHIRCRHLRRLLLKLWLGPCVPSVA